MQKIFLIRNKWEKIYGEVQLAVFEVQHDPKVREGLGERVFALRSWQERIVESGKGLFQKP